MASASNRPGWGTVVLFRSIYRPNGSFVRLLAICIALAAGGCAHQFIDYPSKSAGDCREKATVNGLSMGVDPIFDAATSRTYFDADLPSKHVLALYVVVKNESAGRYSISSDQFTLRGASVHDDPNAVASKSPGTTVAWTGVALISLPVTLVGAAMAVDADNVQTNLRKKTLQTQSLSPGESVAGFIYFGLPKDPKDRPPQWVLRLEPTPLVGSTASPIELTFADGKD